MAKSWFLVSCGKPGVAKGRGLPQPWGSVLTTQAGVKAEAVLRRSQVSSGAVGQFGSMHRLSRSPMGVWQRPQPGDWLGNVKNLDVGQEVLVSSLPD